VVREFAGQVTVEHRCFALAPDPEAISRIFRSPEQGKAEILTHWAAARRHPGGEAIHRSHSCGGDAGRLVPLPVFHARLESVQGR